MSARGKGLTWSGGPKDLEHAYELLIQPIEDLLSTNQKARVIIVPYPPYCPNDHTITAPKSIGLSGLYSHR